MNSRSYSNINPYLNARYFIIPFSSHSPCVDVYAHFYSMLEDVYFNITENLHYIENIETLVNELDKNGIKRCAFTGLCVKFFLLSSDIRKKIVIISKECINLVSDILSRLRQEKQMEYKSMNREYMKYVRNGEMLFDYISSISDITQNKDMNEKVWTECSACIISMKAILDSVMLEYSSTNSEISILCKDLNRMEE